MTFKNPYRNRPFMGLHIDDNAASAYVRLQKWDDSKDGGGNPEESMWYFDETNHVPKYWDGGTLSWREFGVSAPTFDHNAVSGAYNAASSYVVDMDGRTTHRLVTTGLSVAAGIIGISGLGTPPREGTEVLLWVVSGSTDIIFIHESLSASASERLDLAPIGGSPDVTYATGSFPVILRFVYLENRWRAVSVSR